jgi:hypothetical protein
MTHTLSSAIAATMLAMRMFRATERVLCGQRVDFASKMREKPERILVQRAPMVLVEFAVFRRGEIVVQVQEAETRVVSGVGRRRC